jgi:molybdopterin-guanine dinucleotide biosynthesis protein
MVAAAKWLLLAGVLATVGFGCTVSVVKETGEEVDVLKEGDAQKVREAAAGVVADVKEAVIGKKDEDSFEDVVSQDEEQTEDEPRDDGEFRE